MKIPRDLSGARLCKALQTLGYETARQDGEHHVTIPAHTPLKVGTLNSTLKLIAAHHKMSVAQLLDALDL